MGYRLLGDTIMRVNIIYDNRRPEKLELLLGGLSKQGIFEYTLWPPVPDVKSVVRSINLSHKQIVQWAKEEGLKEVCIAEDDLWFPSEDGWRHFLKNKPESFDIYISGTYLIDNPDSFKPPLIKVHEYVGNHLIIVSERYYDKFLSVPERCHIDYAQAGMGAFYVCFPFAALQRPGYSFNAQEKVNYNKEIKPEWVHNGALYNV